jgi:hypothetical protein
MGREEGGYRPGVGVVGDRGLPALMGVSAGAETRPTGRGLSTDYIKYLADYVQNEIDGFLWL